MNFLLEILIVSICYIALIFVLKHKGMLDSYNIKMTGPFAFIRSTRGIGLISKLSRPRTLLKSLSNAGLLLMIIAAVISVLMVIGSGMLTAYMASKGTLPAPNRLNDLRNVLLVPGINEFIPIYFGIVALVIAVMVHELGHAVMCMAQDIKIKSTGIVMMILPIGAFTEPDNDILFGKKNISGTERTVTRVERLRVFASGVAANFITAAVFLSLFFILFNTLTPTPSGQGMFNEINSIYHGILKFSATSWIGIFFLPLIGLNPNLAPGTSLSLSDMISGSFFEPTIFGGFVFPLLSIFLWVGWVNLMIGTFNSLPALPLDGGYVFRDAVGIIMRIFTKDEKKIEKKANVFAGVFSIWIFSSIIITIFAPLILSHKIW